MAGFRPAACRPPLGFVLVIAAALLPGCAKQGPRAEVHPVRGAVTFKGEPVVGALVVFHPKAPSAPPAGGEDVPRSSATTGEGGSFVLSTYDGGDGAPAGQYAVTVLWNKMVGKGNDIKPGPNVLPATYAKPDTTPLGVTVEPKANDFTPFEIK